MCKNCCYHMDNSIFSGRSMQEIAFAAEGVTLSGVRKDEDCKPTGLWRIPFNWVPKVQSVYALISQAKGQSCFYDDTVTFGGRLRAIAQSAYFLSLEVRMDKFFEQLAKINGVINDYVWVKIGLVLLIGAGIVMTCST